MIEDTTSIPDENFAEEKEPKCVLGLCDGSGVIETDEDDGEGHIMRGVGEKRCPHVMEDEGIEDPNI